MSAEAEAEEHTTTKAVARRSARIDPPPERSWVREMAPPPSRAVLEIVTAVLLIIAAASHGAAQAPLDPDSRAADHDGGTACPGMVEECVGGGCEARRRELDGNNYIGYDALRRNAVPCSYRGASYYNCRPGRPANPYSRGCSAITQCRG